MLNMYAVKKIWQINFVTCLEPLFYFLARKLLWLHLCVRGKDNESGKCNKKC